MHRFTMSNALCGPLTRVAGAALVGLALVQPTAPAMAQRTDQPTIQTPFGRAPLTFADIIDKVRPAVVSISVTNDGAAGRLARRGGGQGGGDLFKDLPDDHPLKKFLEQFKDGVPGVPGLPAPGPSRAQGSGFVISADGYIVTNNHVIDGASKIRVAFDENNKFDAKLIGTDSRTDIALLKIDANRSFPFVRFAERQPRVGDWVIAIGNPFGLGGTVTAGIVSALGRDIGTGPYDFLQIDAAVNKGNSGGPTFNLDGEVVGVNTAISSPTGGNVGIAFAVPARTAAEVIAQLQTSGSVTRGWLGVGIQNIKEDIAESLGMKEAKGAMINKIVEGGPAAKAGLKNGDAVVAVNGERIADVRDLQRKIGGLPPNTSIRLTVLRGGREEPITVTLGRLPDSKELARLERGSGGSGDPTSGDEIAPLGLRVAPAASQQGAGKDGVVITEIGADSDATEKGLRKGDVILEVASEPVSSPADVAKGVQRAADQGRPSVLLRVKSGEQTRFVAVRIKKG